MKLEPHSAAPPVGRFDLSAEARREHRALVFDYRVTGRIDDLVLADAAWPERTEDLWETTCFEAFARRPGETSYLEFNFAPSTRWAAYWFSAYRASRIGPDMATPRIFTTKTAEEFRLRAEIEANALPRGPLLLALTAVIQEKSGAKSYWSLAHAGANPDFHALEGFAFDLK